MEICDNCNSEISNDQVYCNKCGQKINPSLLDDHVSCIVDLGSGLEIDSDPITFEYCYQIGVHAFHGGNFYEALEYFNHAITFYDIELEILSKLYNEIGCIYGRTRMSREKAIDFFQLAVSSNPKNKNAYENLISTKISIDDVGAIEDFRKMLNLIPEISPHIFHVVGIASENLKRYEAAKNFYEEAIKRGYEKAQTDLDDVIRKMNKLKM